MSAINLRRDYTFKCANCGNVEGFSESRQAIDSGKVRALCHACKMPMRIRPPHSHRSKSEPLDTELDWETVHASTAAPTKATQARELPSSLYARLRCGLVIGPLIERADDNRRTKSFYTHPTVMLEIGVTSHWSYDGKPTGPNFQDRRFDIVQMFELGEEFDKLRVCLPNKEVSA